MKIAHVITRFVRGGADENTLISCNAQAQMGDEVHLIHGADFSLAMLSRLDARVVRHELPALCRPIRPFRDAQALIDMMRLFSQLRPDIVHTHTSKAGAVGRLAAWLTRVPLIVHGVHILPFDNVPQLERTLYLLIERALAPLTHAFVNVSEGMRTLGLADSIGRPDRHFVVPSGMDTAQFRQAVPFSPEELAERRLRDPARLLVLTAALEPRKRQFEFLDIMAEVRRRVPDAVLVLLGEGHDEARLRSRTRSLGLEQAVVFAGYSEEVPRWVASAHVCVFASERESLPRAVIQYVLGGRPVVSTRLPGIEAVLQDGVGGRLVDVSRLTDMTEPLVELLLDEDLAARMASGARAQDLTAWDQAHMAASLARIYRQTYDAAIGRTRKGRLGVRAAG